MLIVLAVYPETQQCVKSNSNYQWFSWSLFSDKAELFKVLFSIYDITKAYCAHGMWYPITDWTKAAEIYLKVLLNSLQDLTSNIR
jgi:hypothetical protein